MDKSASEVGGQLVSQLAREPIPVSVPVSEPVPASVPVFRFTKNGHGSGNFRN